MCLAEACGPQAGERNNKNHDGCVYRPGARSQTLETPGVAGAQGSKYSLHIV